MALGSIPEWWLAGVARLDAARPGCAGHLLRGSAHWRAVAAVVLAAQVASATIIDDLQMADDLMQGRMAPTISKHMGSCPAGFLGALKRMNELIEPPGFYLELHQLLDDPDRRDVARAIHGVDRLDAPTLAVLRGASKLFLRARMHKIVDSPRARDDLEASVKFFMTTCPSATENAIRASMQAAIASGGLTSFLQRWLSRASFPDAPALPEASITPIKSGHELIKVAARFQNCLRAFLLDILSGTEAFYLADGPTGELVVRIARSNNAAQWELLSVHEKQNRRPHPRASEWVVRMFAAVGIEQESHARPRAPELQPIERLLDPFHYDLEDCLPA